MAEMMRPGWRPLCLLSVAVLFVCSSGTASHRISSSQFGVKSWNAGSDDQGETLPVGRVLRLYGGMDEAAKAARAARAKQLQEKQSKEKESAKDERK